MQAVSSALTGVVRATGSLIEAVRSGSLERQSRRKQLTAKITSIRHSENTYYISELSQLNMEKTFELYDLAETRNYNPRQYEEALKIAQQAAQLLAQNLDHLALTLRNQ